VKKGDDNKVILPLIFGWQTSETYMTAGVVDIPMFNPINTLAIINWMNSTFGSVLLENPMMIQEMIERKFTSIDVIRRPILSDKNPEIGEPSGDEIAVIDANHETCSSVSPTRLSSKMSCDATEGKPRPRPDDVTDKLCSSEIAIWKIRVARGSKSKHIFVEFYLHRRYFCSQILSFHANIVSLVVRK
jgi:hypothetical protein